MQFEQDQYDLLRKCSEKKNLTEWNDWRRDNPTQDICLEKADLQGFYLVKAYLGSGRRSDKQTNTEINYSGQVYLEQANFRDTNVTSASFYNAHLENTCWWYCQANEASFHSSHLNGAHLGASSLNNCNFNDSLLKNADLTSASLCGSSLHNTDLRGCFARMIVVDGATNLSKCKADRETDFTGVALNNVRIDPATKQMLEYYTRRINWDLWYRKHPKLKWITKPFWWTSDYGCSTKRILVVFLGISLLFSIAYYGAALISPPGIVNGLLRGEEGVVPAWLVPVRAFYFSIVTMTTLGFGDMHANCQSVWGHILLILQVLLGYMLLGALVTRFAVLFTAGGPADQSLIED